MTPVESKSIVVKAEGVTKTFGNFTAVKDLDLSIHAGTIYGFLGPNRAGRSALLFATSQSRVACPAWKKKVRHPGL